MFSGLLLSPCVPGFSVLADQTDKSLHLGLGDVFLQQFAVIVQQGSDGVLSQDVVPNLTLHHTELLRYILLERGEFSVSVITVIFSCSTIKSFIRHQSCVIFSI